MHDVVIQGLRRTLLLAIDVLECYIVKQCNVCTLAGEGGALKAYGAFCVLILGYCNVKGCNTHGMSRGTRSSGPGCFLQ